MISLNKFLTATAAICLLAACEAGPTNTSSVDGVDGGYGDGGYANNSTGGSSYAAGSQGDLEANIGDRVFFATDSSVIRGEAQGTLSRQADWLNRYSNLNVVVEGHADERGTREYNLALGERRANAARNYLVGLGVESARITTISYGKERPAVLGHTPSAWDQNRRAVTVVVE